MGSAGGTSRQDSGAILRKVSPVHAGHIVEGIGSAVARSPASQNRTPATWDASPAGMAPEALNAIVGGLRGRGDLTLMPDGRFVGSSSADAI